MPFRSKQGLLALTLGIVDTVREPLLVLDGDLRVVIASRSFYTTFRTTPEETEGELLIALGNGQWDIPSLRKLLTDIIPKGTTVEAFEVEHDFPELGRRCMLLNARRMHVPTKNTTILLLAMQDITALKAAEHEKDQLLREKDLLLKEMQHRVNNSLQIIASILLLKAKTVSSEETRQHLRDAHHRVLAVATVQEQLRPASFGERIEIGSYLTNLSDSLVVSMVGGNGRVSVRVKATQGTMNSANAVSLGLITTELVINALKHAFPNDGTGTIEIEFADDGTSWRLTVSDNGVGLAEAPPPRTEGGLGKSIVEALTRQLGGEVKLSSRGTGTTVVVTAPQP